MKTATRTAMEEPWEVAKHVRPAYVIERSGLPKSTVYKALYTGQLRGHQIGKAWIIPLCEVERWLSGNDNRAA